jgi:DNA-binding MarR family transcriptional regulator
MGSRMHFAATRQGHCRRGSIAPTAADVLMGDHRDRCTSVPIPLRPGCSDTGRVSTCLPEPPAPPSPFPVAPRPAGHDGRPTADRDLDATGWRAGTPAPRAGGMPTSLDGRKRALPVSDDPLARHHRSVAFDRLLESVHREHLSPFDLRVLLRVTDREATLGDLAESMGQPPSVLRRASARLVARGLLRRRRRRNRQHHLEVTLATTASGISALCRVTQALELAPTDRLTVLVAPERRSPTASNTSGRPANPAPAAPLPWREARARAG